MFCIICPLVGLEIGLLRETLEIFFEFSVRANTSRHIDIAIAILYCVLKQHDANNKTQ